MLNSIVQSLGLNTTVFYQMVLFFVSYLILNFLVFKPYMKAAQERENRTLGNEESAESFLDQTRKLQEEYEQEAKALNAQLKGFFDTAREEAKKKYEEIVSSARTDAEKTLSASRAELAQQIETAKSQLSSEVEKVSDDMAAKILGKI